MVGESQEPEATVRAGSKAGTDPIVIAAAASVLLSQYLFFVRGDRELGLFVGLWPPTLFAFTSYFNQQQIAARLEAFGPRSIKDSVQKIVGQSQRQ